MTPPNFKDMTGQKIGKLTVIERAHNDTNHRAQWLCKCECGEEIVVKGNDLRNNRITCCNTCKKRKRARMNNYNKIKQMTVDEMAEIADKTYDDCIVRVFGGQETYEKCEVSRIWDSEDSCSKCFKHYLLQEVEE